MDSKPASFSVSSMSHFGTHWRRYMAVHEGLNVRRYILHITLALVVIAAAVIVIVFHD